MTTLISLLLTITILCQSVDLWCRLGLINYIILDIMLFPLSDCPSQFVPLSNFFSANQITVCTRVWVGRG